MNKPSKKIICEFWYPVNHAFCIYVFAFSLYQLIQHLQKRHKCLQMFCRTAETTISYAHVETDFGPDCVKISPHVFREVFKNYTFRKYTF